MHMLLHVHTTCPMVPGQRGQACLLQPHATINCIFASKLNVTTINWAKMEPNAWSTVGEWFLIGDPLHAFFALYNTEKKKMKLEGHELL